MGWFLLRLEVENFTPWLVEREGDYVACPSIVPSPLVLAGEGNSSSSTDAHNPGASNGDLQPKKGPNPTPVMVIRPKRKNRMLKGCVEKLFLWSI